MSGADENGATLAEAQFINSSLTALASVLMVLSNPDGEIWLAPYRSSKLTQLLRDSLGGSARTVMLTHVRECARHYRQTMLTLAFASRAKRISNNVVVRDGTAAAAVASSTSAAEAAQRRTEELERKAAEEATDFLFMQEV